MKQTEKVYNILKNFFEDSIPSMPAIKAEKMVGELIQSLKVLDDLSLLVRLSQIEKIVFHSYKESDDSYYWENPMVYFKGGACSEFDLNLGVFNEEMGLPHDFVSDTMIKYLSNTYDFVRDYPAGGKNAEIFIDEMNIKVKFDGVKEDGTKSDELVEVLYQLLNRSD